MRCWTTLRGAAAALLLVLAGCAWTEHRPAVQRDNVVVIVIDTLRQDHLATYGYSRDTAPFLGELAREGATFQGLSTSSWTKPAAASLLTGLHPVRHQAFDRWDRIPDGAAPLAERLRREGYQTLAASANPWVSPIFGFARGFDRFLLEKDARGGELDRLLLPALDHLRPPFFLYVHFLDPHAPYNPDIGWDGRPLPAALQARGGVEVKDLDGAHAYPRPPEFLARVTDLYDGEVRSADEAVGTLVKELQRRGLMRSTILVVTADHGEEIDDHGRMGHGQSLYQEVLRIPLLIHAPHLIKGGQRFGRASLLDVVPTLGELLGLKPRPGDPGLDGISLAPFLTGRKPWPAGDRRPFLEHLDFTDGTNLALLSGPTKIVVGKNTKELYDLDADPAEHRNLLDHPGSLADFARLGGELAAEYNAYSHAALDRSGADIDPELGRKMAALGYVAGGREVRQRVIPRRLDVPASDWSRWEPFGTLAACARVGDADSERYVLQGWYPPEAEGRWTEKRASLLVQPTDMEASRLLVSGANFRPGPVRLHIEVEHRTVLDQEVPPGHFELSPKVSGALLREPTEVGFSTDTVFVPAQHGGSTDGRSLGIFLSSVCLEPVARAEQEGP